MSDATLETTQEFACDLNALTKEEREHHVQHSHTLFSSMLEVRELENGYALRLPDAPDTLAQLADFIAHDRRCCPFFTFGIEVEPYGGPIWLRLTGPDGVKQGLIGEFSHLLPDEVAMVAGMR